MSYRDDDDPFEEDIVFDQAGLLSTSRKSSKSAIRRVSSGKCAMFSKTLGLCGAFLGLGLTFAIPGPLSPVPPAELSSHTTLMTYEMMYRCQGFMIGAMFGARLLDRFNRLFLVFLALLVTALLVTIIPWCSIVWLLRTDMFLLGVSLGFLTTGGNVLCLDLWGRNSGPFMQALHFSFSLGVFLAPFLSQPLMAPINYSLVAPTTTQASFPLLHRLPRDVGNMSSFGASEAGIGFPFLPPVSHSSSDFPTNKSWIVNNNNSATLPFSASLPTKTPEKISTQDSLTSKVVNSTLADATLSIGLKPVPQNSTMPPPASQGAASIFSSRVGNQSTITGTPSTTASVLSANSSGTVSASKIDISTTTHRAPRPKPVLVNSEKLQDKKWENEKFRKPPPEDLVPVSTTMKPMIHPDNKTVSSVGLAPTPTQPSLPQGNSSTVRLNVSSNSSKPSNLTSTIAPSLNGSIITTSSPSLSRVPPQAVSSAIPALSSASSSSLAPNNLSIGVNGTVAPVSPTSSSISPEIDASRQTSSPVAAASPTSSAFSTSSTLVKPVSISHTDDSVKYTTFKTDSDTLGQLLDVNKSKVGKFVQTNSSVINKPLEAILNQSRGKSIENVNQNKSVQVTTPSSLVGSEKISNHSSAKVSLPVIQVSKSGNESHDMGKSISLDEQEQPAPNLAEMTQSLTENVPRIDQSEVKSSSSPPPPVRMSTMHPPPSLKPNPVGKTPWIKQKSFGGGHLKTILEAKSVPTSAEEQKPQLTHPYAETNAKEHVPSATKSSDVGTLSTSPPLLGKNLSQVHEDPAYIEPLVSPKHTHHSKPASTVVNDTEVTHTVIDAFANRLEQYGLSRMELMYLTVGMVLLATSFLFLGFLCFNPRDPKSKTDEEDMNGHVVRGGQRSRVNSNQTGALPSRWLRHTLIGLMLLLLMVTSGVQAMYGQLLLVYAIQPPLQLSQSTGSALTATFWGALTSTRFACILLASALSPTAMLVLSVAICSCATWLLSAFASSSEVALWIGSVMVSVGTASVFPSGMLWMQRHVLITHRVAAMLVMGPAMGEMFFPTLAYKMMVSMGSASLIHLPALLSLFAIALWAATWRLARYPRQSLCSNVDESSGYQLANQHDEDDMLDLTMSPIVNGSGAISRNAMRSSASAHSLHRMNA